MDINIIIIIIAIIFSGFGDGIKQSIATSTEKWISNFPDKKIDTNFVLRLFILFLPLFDTCIHIYLFCQLGITFLRYVTSPNIYEIINIGILFGTVVAHTYFNSFRATKSHNYLLSGMVMGLTVLIDTNLDYAKQQYTKLTSLQNERFLNNDEEAFLLETKSEMEHYERSRAKLTDNREVEHVYKEIQNYKKQHKL